MTKKIVWISVIVIIILVVLTSVFYFSEKKSLKLVQSFEECVRHRYPIMESHPRQCRTPDGRTFTEQLEKVEDNKNDLVILTFPEEESIVKSPIEIKGQARGYWFFEGDFLIHLVGSNGEILASSVAIAQGEWMTEEFVEFSAVLEFDPGELAGGVLVLEKNNPSGLPENEDSLEVPVIFENKIVNTCIVTGCSRQVCSDQETATTCEFLAEYSCYKKATCERQVSGECGWTRTEKYLACKQDI